jgi:hypothetical protein
MLSPVGSAGTALGVCSESLNRIGSALRIPIMSEPAAEKGNDNMARACINQ